MFRRESVAALLIVALVAACGAPAARPSPVVSGTPTPTLPSDTDGLAVPVGHRWGRHAIADAGPGDTEPRRSHYRRPRRRLRRWSFAPTSCCTIRGSGEEKNSHLVPVLRTVPKSPATATAAMKALLAGPSAKERAARPSIETVIPGGSDLLGIEIREASRRSTCPPSSPRCPLTTPGTSGSSAPRTSGRGRLHADPIQSGGSRQLQARGQAGHGVVRDGRSGGRFVRGDRPGPARHSHDVPRPLPAADLRRSAGVGCRPAGSRPGHRVSPTSPKRSSGSPCSIATAPYWSIGRRWPRPAAARGAGST